MSKIFTATIPYSRLKTLERLNGGSLSGLHIDGIKMSRNEKLASAYGRNPENVLASLRSAKSCLREAVQKHFGEGDVYSQEGKYILSESGCYALQWVLREFPREPESYLNQQTAVGTVLVKRLSPANSKKSTKWLTKVAADGYSILSVTRQPKAMPGESVLKVQGDGNRAGFLAALLEWQQGLEYAIAT